MQLSICHAANSKRLAYYTVFRIGARGRAAQVFPFSLRALPVYFVSAHALSLLVRNANGFSHQWRASKWQFCPSRAICHTENVLLIRPSSKTRPKPWDSQASWNNCRCARKTRKIIYRNIFMFIFSPISSIISRTN